MYIRIYDNQIFIKTYIFLPLLNSAFFGRKLDKMLLFFLCHLCRPCLLTLFYVPPYL
jgi:hypothetical protein